FVFRLKSIKRYIFLCPPPRNRIVTMPWLFRPPFFLRGTSSDFSGLFSRGLVQSAKSLTEPNRRPAEVGLYKRMPMSTQRTEDRRQRTDQRLTVLCLLSSVVSIRRNQSCLPDAASPRPFSSPPSGPS